MERTTEVIAWALAATFAIVILLGSYDANALTLKKGEVLTSDGRVAHASTTATGQAAIANKGYLISGGQVHVIINNIVVSTDLSAIQGKSKSQVISIIGENAAEALESDVTDELTNALANESFEVSSDIIDAVGEEAFTEALEQLSEEIAQDELDWFESLTEEQKNADTRPDGTAW